MMPHISHTINCVIRNKIMTSHIANNYVTHQDFLHSRYLAQHQGTPQETSNAQLDPSDVVVRWPRLTLTFLLTVVY